MSARKPHQAVEASIERLQLAVSCVTKSVLRASPGGHENPNKVHALLLNDASPAELKGKPKLLLDVKMHYRIVEDAGPEGPWKVRTAAYQYAIETNDGQEIIGFHWHPNTPSPVTKPHVHIGTVALKDAGVLNNKVHVPTGRVALQAVIRHTIELGAKPLRNDWDEVLTRTEAEFLKERSWR